MNLRFEQPFQQNPDVSATAPTTARDPISNRWVLKSGLGGSPFLFVDDIGVTPQVAAGGVVDVEVTVSNTAASVDAGGPDTCRPGAELGFEYEVTAIPSWDSAETQTKCLAAPGPFSLSNKETHRFDFEAPDTGGSETVDVEVRTTGTGQGGIRSFDISVVGGDSDEDVGSRPGTDPIDGGGGGDSPLPEVGSATAGLVLVVVVLFLLLAIGLAAP